MAKIIDFMLPILSILFFWALLEVQGVGIGQVEV